MNLYRPLRFIILLFLTFTIAGIANAQVQMASLFTDGMVLQQQSKVAVWGWDKPGKRIVISSTWDKRHYSAITDAAGKFRLKIATPAAGGPYQLTVSDGTPVVLKNVLIGEVWLCSGQSNMEIPMKGYKGQPILGSNEDILESNNKNIRLFTVPHSSKIEMQTDIKKSQWKEASPESVSGFSAAGYYFGKLLNKMLNVPIGLINCSYAGASIQAWMDARTLTAYPEIKIPAAGDTIKEVSRTPTTLYNAMMHPIIGYGIKGAIWYQGESNYDNPGQYQRLFKTMVDTLRAQWGIGTFPFYYAQIAPYDYAQLPPYHKGGKYNSAFLRDVQRIDEDRIPDCAMAVLMDVGEKATIHPPRKKPVGDRLAYLALGLTYGIKGFGYQSPAYQSLSITGNTAIVKFKNAGNGLTSYFKELTLFEIAGADKHFYPAKAKINGSSVTVSSDQVSQPVAVRYAFDDFTVGGLYGTNGLPVSSFRTDDWDYDAK